jgi:ATP-dependent Lhr-like helicase
VEGAALVRAIREGELDRIEIPHGALDILAQQIVATAATGDWSEDDLFALVRSAYSYRHLERADFDAVIQMLSDGIATSAAAAEHFASRSDQRRVRGRRGARLAAITSGGAIPENANYLVVAEPEGTTVGTSMKTSPSSLAGDVFLLGTTSWRIRRVEFGRVRVRMRMAPRRPFPSERRSTRTHRRAFREVSRLREDIAARPRLEAIEFLMRECALDQRGAEQAVDYVKAEKPRWGLPTHAP